MNQLPEILITLTNPAYHKQQSEKENHVLKRGYRHDDNGKNLVNGPYNGSDDESCTGDNKVDEDKKRRYCCAGEWVFGFFQTH